MLINVVENPSAADVVVPLSDGTRAITCQNRLIKHYPSNRRHIFNGVEPWHVLYPEWENANMALISITDTLCDGIMVGNDPLVTGGDPNQISFVIGSSTGTFDLDVARLVPPIYREDVLYQSRYAAYTYVDMNVAGQYISALKTNAIKAVPALAYDVGEHEALIINARNGETPKQFLERLFGLHH